MRAVALTASVPLTARVALTASAAVAAAGAIGGCGSAAVGGDDRVARVGNVLADPRDTKAHLALAEYDYWHGMPGDALAQLQIVENLGGPLGVQWTPGHRAMMAHLLVMRATARVGRGAASGLPDLEHAVRLGATVGQIDLVVAKQAVALTQLRHVDAEERAKGRALLTTLADPTGTWRGASDHATPGEHGRFGVWLWQQGALREAYEQLELWHRTSSEPGRIADTYAQAKAWWTGKPLVTATSATSASGVPPSPPTSRLVDSDPRIVAAARYAHSRFAGAAPFDALLPIARAFREQPVIVDRLAHDLVAQQVDEAAAHAALGALFDALGDPARARTHWQAAVEAKDAGSSEPGFVRGLAVAAARAGDGPAALIFATQAAAAWGDPAEVWIAVGSALEDTGDHVNALVCAHDAIDLAGPDLLPRALDLAIDASHALGRQSQVEGLRVQRVAAEPPRDKPEPLDPAAAILAYKALPTAGTIARMWVAARAHPGDLDVRLALLAALPADDPRRATLVAEIAAFAADPDETRALSAVRALP
ncbi:MAG: hypothetical protein JO257_10515 [Deltaproteobacteria bacterium]|nr:hypothetical protein [Deltaproteobacteria bacterium]